MLFAATVTSKGEAGEEEEEGGNCDWHSQMAMELKVVALIALSLRRISLGNLIYGIFLKQLIAISGWRQGGGAGWHGGGLAC